MEIMEKCAEFAGADSKTPSVPQYFSWINNTNEGSTEGQTLINLEFFKWLKETYGMEIRIYAWDAGNYDGAGNGYGDVNSDKFKSQYPEGYRNIVAKAAELGIRMGLWGSPDGFGDTEEQEKERFDFFVHLCRDHRFAEFKLDAVCGTLRPEKAHIFAAMLRECRKYSPDLIVLNHRLELYEAEKYVTTFLWNGAETYTDVCICNGHTAMHNRGYMFERGNVDGLQRLAEDHGVCLSSCLDYFEDELIYQAFGRCLILAPEIYGNPWFLKDNEFPRLARVYNLHRTNSRLLVDGMILPESMGCNAVSRGNGRKRYICTGNNSWETRVINITIDESIGLTESDKFIVNLRHPVEAFKGIFNYGESVAVELMPFRAALIEISVPEDADPVIDGCEYRLIKEDYDGTPIDIEVIKSNGGELTLIYNGIRSPFGKCKKTDNKEKAPMFLGTLKDADISNFNCEKLYEAAMFSVDNDCLEARCIKRSGDTAVPEVKAARDAFFSQKLYKLRGTQASFMFDGKADTFFDGLSKTYQGNSRRIDGGCLRIDAGEIIEADTLAIDYFSSKEETYDIKMQTAPASSEYSENMDTWQKSELLRTDIIEADTDMEVIRDRVHSTYRVRGDRVRISYPLESPTRYIRIAEPPDRIFAIRFLKNGKEIKLNKPFANNMQAHYVHKHTRVLKVGTFTVPEHTEGAYIAVAAEGKYGDEQLYCCAEIDGKLTGFPHRAPEYKANQWEHCVISSDKNHTFYLSLPDSLTAKDITIYAMLSCDEISVNDGRPVECNVYLCDGHR